MRHAITARYAQFKRFIQGLIAQLDEAICAREEERARQRGWQITRVGFGARRYRDPRFDLRKPTGDGDRGGDGVPEASHTWSGCTAGGP